MTATKIKNLFEEFEKLEKISNDLGDALDENTTAAQEAAAEEAYVKEFNALQALVEALCRLGYDAKTWRRVIATRRADVRRLCGALTA